MPSRPYRWFVDCVFHDSVGSSWNLRVIYVMCVLMSDSGIRAPSLASTDVEPEPRACASGPLQFEPGLAYVVTLERRRATDIGEGDEQAFFLDTIAEYQWARDVAGLVASSLQNLVQPAGPRGARRCAGLRPAGPGCVTPAPISG
jgi:hypothetical protein